MHRLSQGVRRRLARWFPTRRKVDFVICGTQKGGTTALASYLRDHPEVCMAGTKEVHFFDDEERFGSGAPDYGHYHAQFTPGRHHRVMGEATPIYMYWRPTPRRIFEYNPRMKLIGLLRNPIERAYSHWNMERARGAESLSFWEAITTEAERCAEGPSQQHRIYSYVDRGFYVEQLERLWHHFPGEQVLLLKSSTLRRDPGSTLERVCDFLQVSRFDGVQARVRNSRPYPSPMSDRARSYLRTVFEPEIRSLEALLGWDCSDWLEVSGEGADS